MKVRISNYTFDASAKTITFGDYANISLDAVLLITNTTDNIIIYNFADPTKGGTVATNVLTLTYDTSSMSDTDKLLIYYDEPTQSTPINVTVSTPLPAGTNAIRKLAANDGVDIGNVDVASLPAVTGTVTANAGTNLNTSALALESTLGTVHGHVDSIDTKTPALGQALAAASVPVVLPAAQISTLTPPAAITNFAQETGGNLAIVAGAVSGGHVQADIVGALPAGTANIGDVDVASIAAGDNNIGNVDVVTLPAGSSGKSSDFDTGAGTDNVASYGIAFPASGGAVICPGDATNGMKVQVATALPVGANVIGKVSIDQATPGTTNLVALSAETTKVIGTVRVASGGIASGAIASGAIAAGAIAAGNTSIATTEDTARAGGEHLVKVGAVRLDTLAANANVDASGDYTNFIVDNNGALWVDPQGNVAHDVADAGNPIKIGGRASGAPVTAVSANDRVDAFFDLQGRQVVTSKAPTGTLTNVASSATNVTVLAANAARLGATIWNDSTAALYLKFGATASVTSCTVKVAADGYYEVPFGYTGIIDGIWASANGAARVTEIS